VRLTLTAGALEAHVLPAAGGSIARLDLVEAGARRPLLRGTDDDRARAVRLLFQPLLVVWALWSTGAWKAWRELHQSYSDPARGCICPAG